MSDHEIAGVLFGACVLGLVAVVGITAARRRHLADDDARAGTLRKTAATGTAFTGGGFMLLVGVPVALTKGAVTTALVVGLGSAIAIACAVVVIRRDL